MENQQENCNKLAGWLNTKFYIKNITSQLNNNLKTPKASAANMENNIDSQSSLENPKNNTKTIYNLEKAVKKHSCTHEIKLFKKRFLMLILFGLCSMMNGFTTFQYTVIANIAACYYNIGLPEVNWTCDIHMGVFLLLVFPGMYFMEKKGIRITVIIGAILNVLGSFVQCFTLATDRYFVVMICQTLYALGSVFVLSLPPFIAAVWFGAGEVGLACALGVFGNQLGVALGFILPPNLITNNCTDEAKISLNMGFIAYPMTAINTLILILILFVFQEKPKAFPSVAQATKPTCETNYLKSLKNLFLDINFVLLLLGYGLIVGTYIAISTLLNAMVLIHFPGEETVAGTMGAMLVFAGMIGSVIIGAILDKTHKYKWISMFVFIVSFILMLAYTFLIRFEKIWIQFVMFTLLGFIMTGYLPAGFDLAAEITYPEPEAMSASLLNASWQIFAIVLTNIASPLILEFGDFASNIFFCACLLLGTIIMACMKCKLKRLKADQEIDDSTSQIIPDSNS